MNEFNVYPNIKKEIKLVKVVYNVFDYKPYESCKISCQFFTSDGLPFETKIYDLTGDDFKNWGTDDKYIENWLKEIIYLN